MVARQRRFDPRTWPVRWRLAAASAGLTLAILLVFAAVIGHLATQRIRSDFDRDMRTAVTNLTSTLHVSYASGTPLESGVDDLDDFVRGNGAVLRLYDFNGSQIDETRNAPSLGQLHLGITQHGSLRVVTARVYDLSGQPSGFVQYARSDEHIDTTIERLWLFIAIGVVGGVLLACLAGLTIANRAMQPIASLTATAREIASTRDTSRQMPQPQANDEVGELAQTLEQMLRSLDAARTEREGAMQKQREFVADASHEMRTPLTSVIANLELLQASLSQPLGSEEREIVDSALRSSQRMSRLVADLLLLARADAGRIGERSDCDLSEIVGDAASEIAPVAGDRSLEVSNGAPVPIRGNRDELHRMVINLLDNAIRYTANEGAIEVRTTVDDGAARIEVADDGPGIPAEMREDVFERFVRGAGPADTARGGGTGLGLAIVRAVAESHGGRVSADASPLGGALISVSLPAEKTEQAVTPSLETL
jgi:two-component system OmpR family sensor kinase